MAKLNKKLVIEALHKTKGAVYLAAKSLGCSHTAVYTYINNYPDIKEIKDFYIEELNDIAELKLRQAVHDGDQWAIKFQLSTQGKKRGYVERSEITGADGKEVVIRVQYDDK